MSLGIIIALVLLALSAQLLGARIKRMEQKLEDTREITLIHAEEISKLKGEVKSNDLNYKGLMNLFIKYQIAKQIEEEQDDEQDIKPVNFL